MRVSVKPCLNCNPLSLRSMIYETTDFDANMAAVCGDDRLLRAELLAGFRESLTMQVDLLGRARCDGNWQVAASRIRGLGSSFHAAVLVKLGDEALTSAPGDPVIVRKLREFITSFAQ